MVASTGDVETTNIYAGIKDNIKELGIDTDNIYT